MQKEEENKFLS